MFYRGDFRIPQAPWLVLAICVLLLLPWLGETLFNSKGEPREAIVAVSMLQSGEWILPLNFGQDFPYKPPFMAWIIAGLAWLFNGGTVTEYLSRLPSAIAAICLIFGGFVWARKVRGDRFAIIFSIVTLSCFEVFRASMACRLDMVLTTCMVLPLYILFDIREDRRNRNHMAQWISAWFLLSCAVLTKGPVGALLPGLVGGIYWLLRGERFFPTLFKMLALAVSAMLIPALWYYAAYQRGGEEFLNLMLEENIGRLTGNMSYESHEQPFYYNFITIVAGCLPWTLAALFSLTAARKWRPAPLKPAGLLALTAIIVIVGFYCIPSSKRSVYLLPAYPFLCYAITSLIDSEQARGTVRFFTWFMSVLAVLAPLCFIAIEIWQPDFCTIVIPRWYGWIALAFPLVSGIAWMVNRHSATGHLSVIVWSMYLAYIACIMPAVLNGRSDKTLIQDIGEPGTTDVLILQPASGEKYRLYTLDFYYNDSLRPVSSVSEASACPTGTAVLVPMSADTTGISEYFDYRPLTQRSCDHRRPLGIAFRK